MDLLTQGLLGAATAQAGSCQREARIAAGAGFIAGMLPDVDTLIRSADDPLLVLEYHRHFTHSLIFIPFGALLAALLLWPLLHKNLPLHKLLLYTLLGISLAGVLDACTSYGTHLLWPFSDERVAWNIIAIVDPAITLLLLIPLIIGTRLYSPVFARIALGLITIYLLFAVFQSRRAYDLVEATAARREHTIDRLVVKPTLANLVLWRSVYESSGQIYVDAIHVGLSGTVRMYPGGSLPKLEPDDRIGRIPPDSRTMQDIQRFAGFSDNWLAIHPEQHDLIGDIRYAMLPNSTAPLWGIRINPQVPETPPQFVTNRTFTPRMRQAFINMLRGKDLPD